MKLREALALKSHEVISLVGAGGKTTLMFALARELASSGEPVITTTTTRILEPSSAETRLLLEPDEEKMLRLLLRDLGKYKHITLAVERLPSGKLRGVSPDLVTELAGLNEARYIIVEADGAAGRSLKAPGPDEPVIPPGTSLVIPVVGIDAVGCRLTEEAVFRPEIVARLTGLSLGDIISIEAIAMLITHRQGILRGCGNRARIIPFINKVDLLEGLSCAQGLASRILAVEHPQVERVVLGQARFPEPVAGVVMAAKTLVGKGGSRW